MSESYRPLEQREQTPDEPEGVAEFKRLLSKVAQHKEYGPRAQRVLEYLGSNDWRDGLLDRSYLPLKGCRLYESFWQNFGDWSAEEPSSIRRKAFDTFFESLKNILQGPEVNLSTFQEKPGRFEKDADWYEAKPAVTFYQDSIVENVLRPGIISTASRQRQMKAVVRLKTDQWGRSVTYNE